LAAAAGFLGVGVASAAAAHRDRGERMSLFSEADSERIEAAIRRVEEKSATEVVVAIAPRSGEYRLGRGAVAVAAALCAALALHELWPELGVTWLLLAEVPVLFAVHALLGIGPLQRALISEAVIDRHVTDRAFANFARRGIHQTSGGTGVLIFISELEHRVVILGDRGIHQLLGEAGWRAHVDHIVAAIHRGQAATGVIEVLERLLVVLAESAPVQPGDHNELSDRVVRDA
jgi:putative membrane protein